VVTAKFAGLTAEATVEVVTVAKVSVEPPELKLQARGEPQKIVMRVFDSLGRPLTDRKPMARCQNEAVCRTNNDEVHPVDPGETTLVVSTEGKTAQAHVVVGPGAPEAAGNGEPKQGAKKK
jgi:hypothetical protein